MSYEYWTAGCPGCTGEGGYNGAYRDGKCGYTAPVTTEATAAPVVCTPFDGYSWTGGYYYGALNEGGASCATWCSCNPVTNGYSQSVWKIYAKAGCGNANLFIGCS
jgi:hypothetical protein